MERLRGGEGVRGGGYSIHCACSALMSLSQFHQLLEDVWRSVVFTDVSTFDRFLSLLHICGAVRY